MGRWDALLTLPAPKPKYRIQTNGVKECRRCHDVKPLEKFSADHRYADGRVSWCRQCTNTYNQQRLEKMRKHRVSV